MLLASFGSPSATAYAVADLARRLMAAGFGEPALFQVLDRGDVRAQWHRTPAEARRTALVMSDRPSADLVALFTGGPVLVCCDGLAEIVRYNMRSRGLEFAPALRFATQVLCALAPLAEAPRALRVTPARHGGDLAGLVADLAGFLGLAAEAGTLAVPAEPGDSVGQHVARRDPHARAGGPDPIASPSARALLAGLAEAYAPLVEGRPLDGLEWPPALFLDWDRPGHALDGPVELLGPARFVICGPYLHLPAGRWRMRVEMETRDCLSDNAVTAEAFSGRVLAAAEIALPARRRFGFDLDIAVADPLLPIELRVRLMTGAIEGSLRLCGVSLERRPAPAEPLRLGPAA